MPQEKNIVVTTLPRLPAYLSAEIKSLGYSGLTTGKTEVSLKGSFNDCMKLNLNLRTASRVLFEISNFNCENADDLYHQAGNIPWENYLFRDDYFSIDSFVLNDTIRDNRYANLKLKDAIADRFYGKYGRRPDSGNEKDKAVFYLHWVNDQASIYVDTSGETIAKHGYRIHPFMAPLMESLSSAILQASGWSPKIRLINPMCGSGTLAIEAALLAINHPPGLFRKNFGFQHCKLFDRPKWNQLRVQAKAQVLKNAEVEIFASDHDTLAIEAARENAILARVNHLIKFEVKDFKEIVVPPGEGVIIMNPEYGERLGEVEYLENVYSDIGTFFKNKCSGYNAYVFTGNLELAKKIGLKPSSRQEFMNGKIDCRLLKYEMYKGSKRDDFS